MLEMMKEMGNVGLAIASGIVGIALLALLAQMSLTIFVIVRRIRASRRKPVILMLEAPQPKYLPRG